MDKPTQSGAGKGDKPRPTNPKVFAENFDAIDWGHAPKITDAALHQFYKNTCNTRQVSFAEFKRNYYATSSPNR
jgi:hypothetical protein